VKTPDLSGVFLESIILIVLNSPSVIMKITLTLLLATQPVFLSASSIGSITGLVIDADKNTS